MRKKDIKLDLIQRLIKRYGGSKATWYARFNGTRTINLDLALRIKQELKIPLEIWGENKSQGKANE